MEPLYTLDELVAVVAARLEAEGVAPDNGQVSSRPDVRTMRYYTTLGLLDRPVARRGRVALYGQHHLAQAVAVKRLQAAGWTLAEVQRQLFGMPTSALQRVGTDEVPPVSRAAPDSPVASADLPRRQTAFWAEPPAPGAALVGVHLPEGAVLLLPATRPLTAGDAAALAAAAQPVLNEARRRGLLPTNPPEGER